MIVAVVIVVAVAVVVVFVVAVVVTYCCCCCCCCWTAVLCFLFVSIHLLVRSFVGDCLSYFVALTRCPLVFAFLASWLAGSFLAFFLLLSFGVFRLSSCCPPFSCLPYCFRSHFFV